jgi:hypothetical protein
MEKEITTTSGMKLEVDSFLNFAGEEKYLASVNGDIYVKREKDRYELLKRKEEKEKDKTQ